jgi:hypothetical protein
MICLWKSYRKKYEEKKYFFGIQFLKINEESSRIRGGGLSGVGSRSISQRYGSGDPDPHQNVTDPQHCFLKSTKTEILLDRFLPWPPAHNQPKENIKHCRYLSHSFKRDWLTKYDTNILTKIVKMGPNKIKWLYWF